MADTSAARDEDHGRGADFGHEERIVIGAADHFLGRQLKLATNFKNGVNQAGITKGRRLHIETLDLKIDTAAPTNFRYRFFDTLQGGIASA